MIRNMDYNMAAIVLLIFVLTFFRLKYRSNTYAGGYFKMQIVFIMCTAFFNIISDLLVTKSDQIPHQLINCVFSAYMFFCVGCAYSMTEYVRAFIMPNVKRRPIDVINRVLFSIHIILCIVNAFNGIYLSVSIDGSMQQGMLYDYIYFVSAYYLISSVIRLIHHFSLQKKGIKSILFFVAMTFISALCQFFFLEKVMVIYFAYAVATLFLLFTFETPDFERLIKTTEELRKSQEELSSAHQREDELASTLRKLNRIASWSIYFDNNMQFKEAYWSPEFVHMLGYDDDYDGDTATLWMDSLHPDDKEMATNAFMAGMQGAPYNIEARLIGKNGDAKWYECSGELKQNEEGKVTSYQGFIKDISGAKERQRLANEKAKALEDLEKSQEELKKALFAAREASRAKTTFLSNMSHDIRTPMNAIVGYTQLAQENIDDKKEVEDCLSTIRTSSQHLLALINDVLDMSRIESGKVEVEETPCNLKDIMEDLKKMTFANIAQKNQTFVCDYSGITTPYVLCDRLRLNQILINCIGNANKYTKVGGRIEVALKQRTSDKEGCTDYIFSVKDNGIGMSKEFLERVFEPFERDAASRVDGIQGTGLGMAITKNLVEMMGGRIYAKSELNKGSEFFIELTFKNVNADAIDTEDIKELSDITVDEMVKCLAGKRFLVVDDVMLNRRVVKRLLEAREMIIEECESGKAAIERLSNSYEGEFDMVFMDIQMPEMNGYETSDAIHSMDKEYLRNMKIIAMTANAFEEDKQLAKEHGLIGHVTKPFKVDELVTELYKLL